MLINCTPHRICFQKEDGIIFCVEPSENPFRLETEQVEIGEIEGVKLYKTKLKKARLPKYKEGVYYIVSSLVLEKYKGRRNDLVAPAHLIRNEQGQVIACEGLTL